jgi:hypothetical protein
VTKSLRLKVFLTGRVATEANGRVLNEARFRRRQGRPSALHVDHRRGCPLVADREARFRSPLLQTRRPSTECVGPAPAQNEKSAARSRFRPWWRLLAMNAAVL